MYTLPRTILIFLLTIAIHAAHGQGKTSDGFELVKEDDDIFIYERWTIFPKSKPPVKAREVKGVFKVKTTIAEAIALVQNEKKIQEWQKHVSEFKVYPQADTTWWEEYSYHDIPWPVSDQDHFLIYEIDESSKPDRVFITFETMVNNQIAPVREGVSRMTLAGSWLFEKMNDGRVKITYSILSMPSSIPRIFTDPVIRNNMMSTIKGYIAILENREVD
jgi:hypothetical protein